MKTDYDKNLVSLEQLLQAIAIEGSLELSEDQAGIYGTLQGDELVVQEGGEDG